MKTFLEKVKEFIKNNFLFLLVIALLSVFMFTFIKNGDLEGRDWFQFGRLCREFGEGPLLLKFPLDYWLSQYSSTFISIEVVRELFGYNTYAYYFLNIASRALLSVSIYLFVTWWSGKKTLGYLSGLIFFLSYAGIESTTWVTNYTIYLNGAALILGLYFWRKSLMNPSIKLIEIAILVSIFVIAFGHTRIFALPLLYIFMSIYYLILNIKNKKNRELIGKQIIVFSIIFGLMYVFTDFFKEIPAIASKINSVPIMLTFVVTGFQAVIHSLFLFLGNLILPPKLVETYVYPLTKTAGFSTVQLLLFMIFIYVLLFSIFLIVKKKFIFLPFMLIPLSYPFALYLSQKSLMGWSDSWVISAMIGGSLFPLFLIIPIYIWNKHREFSEMIILGVFISTLHISIPWFMFHVLESNEASAFLFTSRYYTVPMVGICLIVAGIVGWIFAEIKPLIDKKFFSILKVSIMLGMISLFLLPFVFQAPVTVDEIKESTRGANPTRHKEIWSLMVNYLLSVEDKSKATFIYIEGNQGDLEIVQAYFPLQLMCEGFRIPNTGSNITFITDKTTFEKQKEKMSDEEVNILSLRIEKDRIVNLNEE